MAKKKSKKNGSASNHANGRAAKPGAEPRAVAALAASGSLESASAGEASLAPSSISVVALNEAEAPSHTQVSMLSAEAACPSVTLDDPLADVFTALELDFFRRAEELYATTFERWEDFDKDPN